MLHKVAKQFRLRPEDIKEFTVVKKSVDARKKPDIFFTYTVRFRVSEESRLVRKNRGNKNLTVVKREAKLEDQIERLQTKE